MFGPEGYALNASTIHELDGKQVIGYKKIRKNYCVTTISNDIT